MNALFPPRKSSPPVLKLTNAFVPARATVGDRMTKAQASHAHLPTGRLGGFMTSPFDG
jgi:hypothetical protein